MYAVRIHKHAFGQKTKMAQLQDVNATPICTFVILLHGPIAFSLPHVTRQMKPGPELPALEVALSGGYELSLDRMPKKANADL